MIKFWRVRDKFGEFSNFYQCDLWIDNKYYPSTEHYYQTQKSLDPTEQDEIRTALSPKESKNIAQKCILRPDWEEVKYNVMLKANLCKFKQHDELKNLLLSTGDEELAEDSPYDAIWGLGKDGTGTNLLGKVLMEVRTILKQTGNNPEISQ